MSGVPKLRRAFTLVETIIVIAIIATIAAILFPVFVSAKRAAQKSVCISNLRQFGQAISMYRSEYNGIDVGTPSQMGLPPINFGKAMPSVAGLRCSEFDPKGHGFRHAGYTVMWINAFGKLDNKNDFWTKYVEHLGSGAVIISDAGHQPDEADRDYVWENWTALGLRLDGSVAVKTKRGFPFGLSWWW